MKWLQWIRKAGQDCLAHVSMQSTLALLSTLVVVWVLASLLLPLLGWLRSLVKPQWGDGGGDEADGERSSKDHAAPLAASITICLSMGCARFMG